MPAALDRLLKPRSVAIIGASQDPAKRGHQAVRSLRRSGFRGDVYPVHPAGGTLLDFPVYPSLKDLPTIPDLALVAVGSARVPAVIEACSAFGIPGAVVLAVGFRETGTAGRLLEDAMLAAARRSGLRIIGPNTSGIINPALGFNLVGADAGPAGGIALLSQSGNVGLDVMTRLRDSGAGLSLYVGVGNEADVGFGELLDYVANDPTTRSVMVYAEGFRDGRGFLDAAERLDPLKPVLVLKGGRSKRGESAALSHTGATTGSFEVFRALAFERELRVARRSDEFVTLGASLATQPSLRGGGRIVVIADGGGHATLASDILTELGHPPEPLDSALSSRIRSLLGPAAATENPLDLAGTADARPEVFAELVRLLAGAPDVSGLLMTGLFGGYGIRFDPSLSTAEDVAARDIADVTARERLPLAVHTIFARRPSDALTTMRRAGIPVSDSLEVAAGALVALEPRNGSASGVRAVSRSESAQVRDHPVVDKARSAGRSALTEWETRQLLADFDIPVAPGRLCRSVAEVRAATEGLAGPAVLKLNHPDFPHRSDVGGVVLGIEGPDEAEKIYLRLWRLVTRSTPVATEAGDVSGVIVSPELDRPSVELLVTARRDPQYGPVLIVARGGLEVELASDRAIFGLPLRNDDLASRLGTLEVGPLLRGHRGRPGVDMVALLRLCRGLETFIGASSGVLEIELNPVFATPGGVVAVDALAVLTLDR